MHNEKTILLYLFAENINEKLLKENYKSFRNFTLYVV